MIEICIRGAFVLVAVAMGFILAAPAENDAAQFRLVQENKGSKDVGPLCSWIGIVLVSGIMWAGVYLAIKGI